MFYIHSSVSERSNGLSSETPAIGIVVCAPMFWPQTASSVTWTEIYRLAHEQLLAAFAPSPFQRMIEPSAN
jgi:hypothetical protein